MKRIEKIPVPAVPTMLALCTLANVYGGLGFVAFRWTAMIIGTIFLCIYLLKMIMFPGTFRKEYIPMVPSSLIAGFTMCWMVIGSFFYEMGFAIGKVIWVCAVFIHLTHLVIFITRFILLKRSWETTMPCWFVTLNGIMVSCVTGGAMNFKWLLVPITWYGIVIYLCCLPFMIYRLIKKPIPRGTFHTIAILLAPVSLCIVSIINVPDTKPMGILYLMIALYFATCAMILVLLPKFFSYPFYPGYAGLTFPLAIGCVAAGKLSGFFAETAPAFSSFMAQFQGFLIFFTTTMVGYVLIKFVAMLFRVEDAK
ncbi:MAG: TDT family transporter [Lachnospiraceae bacterium]|nr:TDT family transporter [Lachnospiraceae bacterium]